MAIHDFESLFVGKNHIRYEVTDSTNDRLKQLLTETNLPEGTAISADYQTAGRGQRGAGWESNSGQNILLSVLFYPRFIQAEKQFILSETIALGVRDFISRLLPKNEVLIKWPNDILVDKKKIAGILIENVLEGRMLKSSIAGIGININQEDLPDTACSVYSVSAAKYDIPATLNLLFSFLEKRYLQLKRGDALKIHRQYLDALHGKDKELPFERIDGTIFRGQITGVTPGGLLQIQSGNELLEFSLKEIRFL